MTDDTLMKLASKAIFDDLKKNNRLGLLPAGATHHTLHHMYLSDEVYLRFEVSDRGWDDPPRTFIHIIIKLHESLDISLDNLKDNLTSFSVDFQHCGQVNVKNFGHIR